MSKLKLLWTDIGGVQFKGSRGIIRAWGDEMARHGWDIESDPAKWEGCDLVFFGSDSQLPHLEHVLGKKPTILYFWGWEFGRLLDPGFQGVASEQLQRMAQCTRILVPSVVTMCQAADFGLPSVVCHPGVDTHVLDTEDKKGVRRGAQVMFLSRLVPHKQLDVLIEAMSLIQSDPPLKLLVCGPGYSKPYIEKAKSLSVTAEFVELTDEVKATEIRKSAVLVHPSAYEGFGLPPVEALYCGTPVIAFDTPQNRHLLQENAFYFSSVDGLAQAIGYVFQNPTDVMERVYQGQQMVSNYFTLNHACGRLWPHIHQVIKEHLGRKIRTGELSMKEAYEIEHKRNWEYGSDTSPEWASGPARFDPEWKRHWRATHIIEALKKAGAKTVLDVGCGPVYPTIFAKEGFDVTALDISSEALRQVKEIADKWGVVDKVKTVEADAYSIPEESGKYDAVIHGEIYEHLEDPVKVMVEGLRVLKSDGVLIFSTPYGEHHNDPMHLNHYTDAEFLTRYVHPATMKAGSMCTLMDYKMVAEEGTEPSCIFGVIKKG